MYPNTKEVVYLYDQYSLSVDDGILYHFTSADNFFKIIESMTLKSSDLSKLNDLNEGNLINGNMTDACLQIQIEKALCLRGTLLCFTENFESHGLVCTGINHPRMWAQYADNNKGVCIAIKKKQFLTENQKLLQNTFYKLEKVDYKAILSFTFQNMTNVDSFIKTNWHDILFVKHEDWCQENEVRFFGFDLESDFLSIENSVAFICLSHSFLQNESNMMRLMNILISPNSKCYQKLIPNSFAVCLADGLGYNPADCSNAILATIKSCEDKSDDYLTWLKNELNYEI